jgi:hypothetical protein
MAHVHRSTHKNKAIIVLIGTIFWTCESSSSFAVSHWITMHSDEILGGYEFFMSLAQSPRSWSWAVWRKPWPMWPHPWRHGQHRHHMMVISIIMVMVKPRNRQEAGALGTNSLQAPWRRQGLCWGDFFRWIENFHQLSHSKPSFWLIWLMCWFVICFMYRFLALWLITLHVNKNRQSIRTANQFKFKPYFPDGFISSLHLSDAYWTAGGSATRPISSSWRRAARWTFEMAVWR